MGFVRTLLGAKAPPFGIPPVAIVLYYLQHKDGKMDVSCTGNTKASLTPPSPWGQYLLKKGFLQSIFLEF